MRDRGIEFAVFREQAAVLRPPPRSVGADLPAGPEEDRDGALVERPGPVDEIVNDEPALAAQSAALRAHAGRVVERERVGVADVRPPHSGEQQPERFIRSGTGSTEMPVWAFHGAQDDIVPVVHIEGPMDRIRACEGAEPVEMELTVYPDAGHDAGSRTYDRPAGHAFYAWMLEHTGA